MYKTTVMMVRVQRRIRPLSTIPLTSKTSGPLRGSLCVAFGYPTPKKEVAGKKPKSPQHIPDWGMSSRPLQCLLSDVSEDASSDHRMRKALMVRTWVSTGQHSRGEHMEVPNDCKNS